MLRYQFGKEEVVLVFNLASGTGFVLKTGLKMAELGLETNRFKEGAFLSFLVVVTGISVVVSSDISVLLAKVVSSSTSVSVEDLILKVAVVVFVGIAFLVVTT